MVRETDHASRKYSGKPLRPGAVRLFGHPPARWTNGQRNRHLKRFRNPRNYVYKDTKGMMRHSPHSVRVFACALPLTPLGTMHNRVQRRCHGYRHILGRGGYGTGVRMYLGLGVELPAFRGPSVGHRRLGGYRAQAHEPSRCRITRGPRPAERPQRHSSVRAPLVNCSWGPGPQRRTARPYAGRLAPCRGGGQGKAQGVWQSFRWNKATTKPAVLCT